MIEQYVNNYALALFSLCKESGQSVKDVYDELCGIDQILSENGDFVILLSSPVITEEEKLDMLKNAFEGNISDTVYDFICVLTENRHITDFSEICKSFKTLYYQDENIVEVTVKTTVSLSGEQRQKLISKLESFTGMNIILNEEIDETLIGGIVVNYNDTQIDASIKGRLAKLKTALAAL